MKITTEVTKDAYKEVNKYIMPSKVKKNNIFHITISILTIIFSYIFKFYVLTILGIMTLIINIYIHKKTLKEQLERNDKIFDKLYNGNSYKITIQFKDGKLNYLNHQYKKDMSVDYKDIKSFKKTKNYYVLTTKDEVYLIIDKNDADYKKIK
jgi:hypothetical protein